VSGAGLVCASPPGTARWYGHQLHRVEEYRPEELNAPGGLEELRAFRLDRSLPHNFERLADYREHLRRYHAKAS